MTSIRFKQGRTGHLDILEKYRTAVHPEAVGLAGSSSKKKCQIKCGGVSIYTNSAHQRVIELVKITKDGFNRQLQWRRW